MASLDLISQIRQDESISQLLMIFTCRKISAEIQEKFISENDSMDTFKHIEIPPLSAAQVKELLEQTLFPLVCDEDDLIELSKLVQIKTLGNPHHIREFLKIAEMKGHIYFSRKKRSWSWCIEDLETGVSMAENVVDYMLERMSELPAETARLVEHAACMGDLFDFDKLSDISGIPRTSVVNLLWPATKEGILVSSIRGNRSIKRGKHTGEGEPLAPMIVSSTNKLAKSSSDIDSVSFEQILDNPLATHSLLNVEV